MLSLLKLYELIFVEIIKTIENVQNATQFNTSQRNKKIFQLKFKTNFSVNAYFVSRLHGMPFIFYYFSIFQHQKEKSPEPILYTTQVQKIIRIVAIV